MFGCFISECAKPLYDHKLQGITLWAVKTIFLLSLPEFKIHEEVIVIVYIRHCLSAILLSEQIIG